MSDPIRPIGPADAGPAPVPAVRRLTPKEREQAARERARKRGARRPAAAPERGDGPAPEGGGGSVDVRA